jgi:serine/threonine protein kinase/tetratricopeptide (TPR) repeat protein
MATWNQRANELFLHARDMHSADERRNYLDGACAADATLRAEVEALLEANARAGSFLESPASVAPLLATVDGRSAVERPGTVIGSYKLLEQIGEGGFGVVFLAEQQRPVRRKVALKVLKPGMDTRHIIARFEAERQALALMDHPNIAKVLDGGQTAGGRPYFVMDLVKGLPITDYCDQAQLTPRERLGLFLSVCQAVQHAHQKGIIHRDLKPSNVLVTVQDTTPVVKVIDFGVAKALGQQLTDKTLCTGFAQLIGTPLYMSPEQAGESSLDVDTRSDIYTLGVLLYELLTGTTPFQKERFQEIGYDELRRIIREEEPPRPSTRVSILGQAAATISAQRKSDPKRLSQLCRGELDWIVMRCLEKDRNRRYETASGLAADVHRFLNDEPVLACPPSAAYRLKKFVRRNRQSVLAVAVVLLGLLAGIAGAVVGLVRARDEAESARRAQAAEVEQSGRAQKNLRSALRVLDEIYLQVAEDRVPRDPRQEEKEHELLRKALVFYREFAEQNSADMAVSLEVVRANRRVGDIERLVGQHGGAAKTYAVAIARAEQLVKDFPGKPEYAYELAASRNAFGEILAETGKLAAADEQFHEAIRILTQLDLPAAHEYQVELARSHHGLGLTLKQRGQRSKADKVFQQAIELQAKLATDFPHMPHYRAHLAQMHRSAGRWQYLGPGDDRAANEHLRSAIKLLRGLVKDFPTVPLYRQQLAAALGELGIQDWSTRCNWQEIIDLLTRLASDFPTVPGYRADLALAIHNAAYQQFLGGDLGLAAAGLRKGLDMCRTLARDFPKVTRYRASFAVALLNCAAASIVCDKDFSKARRMVEEALAHLQPLAKAHPRNQRYRIDLLDCYSMLSGILAASGQPAEAAKKRQEMQQVFYDTVAALAKAEQGPSAASAFCQDVARILLTDGNIWLKVDRTEEGMTAYRHAIKAYGKAMELDPKIAGVPTALVFRDNLGWYQEAQKRAAIEKTADILQRLLNELPDSALRKRFRLDVLGLRASVMPGGHSGNMETLYREQAALLKELAAYCSEVSEHRDAIARNDFNLAHLLKNGPRSDEAEKLLVRAITVWGKLADEHPDRREYRQHQAYAYGDVAALLVAKNRLKKAEQTYRQGIEQWQKLVDHWPGELWYRHELSYALHALGMLLKTTKRPDEAEKAFREALALEEAVVASTPTNPGWIPSWAAPWVGTDYRGRLCDYYMQLWLLLRDAGRFREAAQVCRQETAVVEKVIAQSPNAADYQVRLATRYNDLVHLLKAAKQPQQADQAVRRALQIWEKTVATFRETIRRNPSFAWASNDLAWRLATDPEPQRRDGRQAVAFARLAVESGPTNGYWVNTLGAAHYRAGSWKEAVTALQKSIELRKGGDSFDWFFLAMAHWQLGEKETARKWFDQAVQWMDKHKPRNEELRRFRAEAAELLGAREKKK